MLDCVEFLYCIDEKLIYDGQRFIFECVKNKYCVREDLILDERRFNI